MGFGGIRKAFDQRMRAEHLMHTRALYADAAAVDQANLAQPSAVSLGEVLVDHRWDVARVKRVQVENAFDRDLEGVVVAHSSLRA